MEQLTLARQAEFQRDTKKTRREQFLGKMEAVMPWAELQGLVEPHYSQGETGRKPGVLRSCCGFTFCSSGSRCRTRRGRCTVRVVGAAALCRNRSGPRSCAG
jgi:hypothetical protein